ncbi:MAG: superoxide dismutase [Phycisphaerales bacterium]|nr:superoxide dismutase [Phycisphaerales bacterium]
MPFTLAPLPYPAAALEPHIDARTMEIHHGKHHAAYVTNANKALEGTPWANAPVEKVLADLGQVPEVIRNAVRNNAGGHWNHSFFWSLMAPANAKGGGEPTGALASAITGAFGSFATFKEKFGAAGAGRFGSGWAWLCLSRGTLEICSTANQDNPLMHSAIGAAAGCAGTPILGIDVWEHAYYLHYQNRRADYIGAWWNVVNWSRVSELFAAGAKG